MRILTIGLCLLCLSGSAISQITVTYPVYKSTIEAGFDIHSATNAEGATFNLGTPGASDNVYHFENFEYDPVTDPRRYSDPSDSPYFDKYQNATHMIYDEEVDFHQYYQLSQDGLFTLGAGLLRDGIVTYFEFTPPFPLIKFPLTHGSSWEYSGKQTQDPVEDWTMEYYYIGEVISTGTLITPAGTGQCLVVKRHVTSQLRTSVSTRSFPRLNYDFVQEDGLKATIEVDTSYIDSNNPYIIGATYSTMAVTDVAPTPTSANTFLLHDSYPNPVLSDGKAFISWTAGSSANISIALYDVRGVEVAKIYKGRADAGTHTRQVDISNSPAGLYIVRMSTPEGVQSRKIVKME